MLLTLYVWLFLFSCIYTCVSLMHLVSKRPKDSPGTEVTDSCKLLSGCWVLNPDSLQEQVLLSTKAFLQPSLLFIMPKPRLLETHHVAGDDLNSWPFYLWLSSAGTWYHSDLNLCIDCFNSHGSFSTQSSLLPLPIFSYFMSKIMLVPKTFQHLLSWVPISPSVTEAWQLTDSSLESSLESTLWDSMHQSGPASSFSVSSMKHRAEGLLFTAVSSVLAAASCQHHVINPICVGDRGHQESVPI